MTDLVPVITAASTIPAVIFKPEERIVRLGDLGVARENLRWGEPPDDDIPTLAATLKAAGQLQPVTVRPGRGKKEQPWMALDGRRRRLALAMLLEAGDIDEDYPVRTYVETDPARQAAAVLLTNTAVPVHVADVIAAIGRMLKSKLTLTTMARALGYAEIDIRRLGDTILAALVEPAVVEILANPDGRLILDRSRGGRQDTGAVLSAESRERVIRLIADYVGETVTRDDPRLSGVLPGTGERFQGILPPVTSAPAFSIRKRPSVIWGLEDYVLDGAMTEQQAAVLRGAAEERLNILISGGTGSGKTTLANAVLAEPAFAQDRVFLVEDTPELQCSAWDTVSVLTRRQPISIGVVDLVRDALRMRPDRIVVGEMRDGAAALETLKSWNTGHPGGLSTLHANSADDVLRRIEDLIAEVSSRTPRRAIAQAIDRIVHIRRTAAGRRVEAVLGVEPSGDDGYAISVLA